MRLLFLGLVATMIFVASQADAQVLFSDDFDDGNAAARWSAPIVGLEDPNIGPDSTVEYNFDYSAVLNANGPNFGLSVPPAPNGDGVSTTGIFMTANNTDQCPADPNCTDGDEGEAVGIVSNFELPAGSNYSVQADVYAYWNNGGGSTEYTTIGINHDRSNNVPLRFEINGGSGIAWAATGDGDTTSDLVRFNSNGYGGVIGNDDIFADYQTDFAPGDVPGTSIGEPVPGGIFGTWVEMEITYIDGISTLTFNGTVIDVVSNPFSGGGILLAHADAFNSVNLPIGAIGGFMNGTIWDNIIVTAIPEPTSILLIALGTIGLAVRRRV